MRTTLALVAMIGGLTLGCAPAPAAPTGAPPATDRPATPTENPVLASCSRDTAWGSADESVADLGPAPLWVVRAGTFPCADRLEFEIKGRATGYSVGYVDAVVQDGSGATLSVPGNARLQVQLHHPAYDETGRPTFFRRVGEAGADVRGYPTLQSVVFGGSFEGYTTFGVGVRARLPFRVWIQDGRLIVLEVAHRWP